MIIICLLVWALLLMVGVAVVLAYSLFFIWIFLGMLWECLVDCFCGLLCEIERAFE